VILIFCNPGPPPSTTSATGLTPISGTEDTFQLPNGLTIAIAANANNSATDTYTFDVPYRGNASGDNAVNLANALKLTASPTLGGSSLDEYYAGFVGEIGIQMENATRLTDNQKTLVDQIITWRESVSGVNMDEEMTNMIRYQKGYNAAARVLTTLDEMLDKLINGTGVVGR
jgi:flagellar hook-associated protein 1 FlgK